MFGTFDGSQSIYSIGAYCEGIGIIGNCMTSVMSFSDTSAKGVTLSLFWVFVLFCFNSFCE